MWKTIVGFTLFMSLPMGGMAEEPAGDAVRVPPTGIPDAAKPMALDIAPAAKPETVQPPTDAAPVPPPVPVAPAVPEVPQVYPPGYQPVKPQHGKQ